MKVTIEEKLVSHPMEEFLGIESGTTMIEHKEFEIAPIQQSSVVEYDEKDDDIEQKLDDIYNLALNQVTVMSDELELVEGRYKAGLAETSTQMLTVALGAIRERSLLKQHKDKLQIATDKINIKRGDKNITNNNLIVANRNEILKMIADGDGLNM
jgi:hypothetical protein